MSISYGEYATWPLPGKETSVQDRDCQIIETLATKLVGWRVCRAPDPHQGCYKPERLIFDVPEIGGTARYRGKNRPWDEEWNPLTDWRAAGEVLEKMRLHPKWNRFADTLLSRIGDGGILESITPRLIAEAVYEALGGQQHDD